MDPLIVAGHAAKLAAFGIIATRFLVPIATGQSKIDDGPVMATKMLTDFSSKFKTKMGESVEDFK